MMTIGEFALSTGLSVKALRFYDERGLLAPADVDPHSGYRRYSAAQLRTATTIRILRTAGLSVEDVKTALDEPDRLAELLQHHAAEMARRRDLEDRAMALGRGLLDNGGTEAGKASADRIQFRTAEEEHWVAVVQRLHLDADDLSALEEAADQIEGHLDQLTEALQATGIRPVGMGWTGLRPVNNSFAVVDQLVSLTLEDASPSLAVPGLRIETGTLPKREEAFVTFSVSDDSPDMLSDAPGGPLAPEELIALSEFLEARGIDSTEMLRQRAVGDQPADESMPVVAEAAVTVGTLG